jgi:hypothetical protein
MSTAARIIKTPEALAALRVLAPVRGALVKRPLLERLMAAELGRPLSDAQFEAAMDQLGPRIIRVRGQGGGIGLF